MMPIIRWHVKEIGTSTTNHKEANGLWDFPFPYFKQLELVQRLCLMETRLPKRKTRDMESKLEGINLSFQMFVQGFNANFGTMANVVVDAMTDDNNNKKAKSKQLKDLINELMKPNILSGNVLYAAEIFETNKDKLDLSLNLSHHMPMSYVHKLTSLPLGH
ncbi:hypothetical protein Tco_0277199 [Tanacetum coccineum]